MLISDFDRDGKEEIILGGTSNAYNAATLVVLDPELMAGASSQENQEFQLLGMSPGREKARLLFPCSCINLLKELRNSVSHIIEDEIGIIIYMNEWEDAGPPEVNAIYALDRNLEFVSNRVSDTFEKNHRALELSGALNHALTDAEVGELRKIRRLK